MAKKVKNATASAMDYPEHERTYVNFVRLFKWSAVSMAILLALMALFLL